MKEVIDLSGTKFFRWNIIERAENGKQGHIRWKCKCDCGKESIVYGFSLNENATNQSKSCGCLRKELVKIRFKTHGYESNGKCLPEYTSWHSMLQRCGNPKHKQYKDYGERGITVCNQWKDFQCFINDMGDKPSDEYSIDRINNSGNYEPNNCKWSTDIEQANNKRNNRFITVGNEKHTVSEWSRIVNTKRQTLQSCLTRHGEIEMVNQFIAGRL